MGAKMAYRKLKPQQIHHIKSTLITFPISTPQDCVTAAFNGINNEPKRFFASQSLAQRTLRNYGFTWKFSTSFFCKKKIFFIVPLRGKKLKASKFIRKISKFAALNLERRGRKNRGELKGTATI